MSAFWAQWREPIVVRNPITVQLLGLCSALAVTQSLWPTLIMAAAVLGVISFSSVAISLLRHQMPSSIRLILEMTIIASAVIIADELIKTYAPDISRILSVFVGLIITNCILLGRAESFALHNNVALSFADGLGNGVGYSLIILIIAALRELFGQGRLFGHVILSPDTESYPLNQFMTLPASAFFLVALIIWALHHFTRQRPRNRGHE